MVSLSQNSLTPWRSSQAKLLESEQSPRNRTSFIVLSDVHLDNHKVMKALGEVLGAYEGMEQNDQPSLFILFGNFRSRPYLCDGSSSREYEGELARSPPFPP